MISLRAPRLRRRNPCGALLAHVRARRRSDRDALAKIDAYWRAANYLSVGQIYLYDNPLLKEPLTLDAHQAAPARPLGHDARAQLHLHAFESRHRRARSVRAVRDRAGPRRAGARGEHLSRRHVQRALSRRDAGRGRLAQAVQAILVSRRHTEPRRPRNAGVDPRRRRTRLFARARLRRRFRQSRPARRLRHRRRRSRNRSACRELAIEQVSESRARRCRAADPAFERLQDCRTDGSRADPARRARSVPRRARTRPLLRRRRRADGHAPDHGRHARPRDRRHPRDPARRANSRLPHTSALADDRARFAEGLDRAEARRRQAGRGHLSLPPGAARGNAYASRARRAARALDEKLPAARALRRERASYAPSSPRWPRSATGGWAPIRSRTADSCCAICACRTIESTRSSFRAPAPSTPKRRACRAPSSAT